jgi:4-hydroxy-tetrahydrodipicolinate synthase
LPLAALINYENRQGGLLAAKALMEEGGVIRFGAPRAPLAPLHRPRAPASSR